MACVCSAVVGLTGRDSANHQEEVPVSHSCMTQGLLFAEKAS